MRKINKKTLAKILIVVPFLLVLYILQSMVFTHITLWGVKPLLLPLAVAGVALFDGAFAGGIFGIFAGVLCDMSFNQPTIAFTLVLTFLGIGIGFIADTLLVRGFPSYLLISFFTLLVCSLIQMFPLMFFYGVPFGPLFYTATRQVIYSLIFTIPMYYLTRFVSRVM